MFRFRRENCQSGLGLKLQAFDKSDETITILLSGKAAFLSGKRLFLSPADRRFFYLQCIPNLLRHVLRWKRKMKSGYRTFLIFLVFPMAFGYNPVTDTLSQSFDLDLLTGQSNYWTGCESPTKTMTFQEIHAGYRKKVQDRATIHVDGGLLPTDVEPVDSYGGGKKLYGYINGGVDCDWEYLGFGVGAGTKTFLGPLSATGKQENPIRRLRIRTQVSTGIFRNVYPRTWKRIRHREAQFVGWQRGIFVNRRQCHRQLRFWRLQC